jgi:hypothetical protein
VKEKVYTDKSPIIDDFKENIHQEIAVIPASVLQREDGCHLGSCAVYCGSVLTDVSEVIIASVIRAVSGSTRHNKPEDSHHIHRRENLTPHHVVTCIRLFRASRPIGLVRWGLSLQRLM